VKASSNGHNPSSNGTAPLNGTAAVAEPQTLPYTSTKGLIFGTGETGAWDEASVGSPVVRLWMDGAEQRWVMWYSGAELEFPSFGSVAPASGSIGVAVSSDGVNWVRGTGANSGGRAQSERDADVGRLMEPNEDSWWWMDTCHLAVSDVQVFGDMGDGAGVFWMFYQGADYEALPVPGSMTESLGEEDLEGLRMRPGLAMSQDGKNWARIEGDHHTGALFDVGEAGEWDELFIGHPQVVSVGPKELRMYYHSYDLNEDRYKVGVAVSDNGFRWQKKGVVFEGGKEEGAFDGRGAAARHVIRNPDNGDYLMFYEAVGSDDTRSIGLAVSKNGLSGWKRMDSPLLSPSGEQGSWDCAGVGAPRAVPMANSWRLYYSGRSTSDKPWNGIGLALSAADGPKFEGMSSTFTRRQGS